MITFQKWHSLGNDYLILDRSATSPLTPPLINLLCDRNKGVGGDGIAIVDRSVEGGFAASIEIFNPDGSQAELSGNGARQVALYLHRQNPELKRFTLVSASGEIGVEILTPTSCRIDIGRARLQSSFFPGGPPDGRGEVTLGEVSFRFQHSSVGNPQCALRVTEDQFASLDVGKLGATLEVDPRFPDRTNVSFWRPVEENRIDARIYERGAGETSASGTGACGAAIAHVLDGGSSPVTVTLPGGELIVTVGEDLGILLEGPAEHVFDGRLRSVPKNTRGQTDRLTPAR